MSEATKTTSRTVVGVSLSQDELAELDRQRAQLGERVSRAAAMKLMWENLSQDAVGDASRRSDLDEAVAESLEPLVTAMKALSDAWVGRANQRQAIGVHSNQIAKLANVLRMKAHNGQRTEEPELESIALATEGIERRLDVQSAAEREDDQLRADVRAVLDQVRAMLHG